MSTVLGSRRLGFCDHCWKEYDQRFPPLGLAKGQGKLGFTTEPEPKRPQTDIEQDELARLYELPEEPTESWHVLHVQLWKVY